MWMLICWYLSVYPTVSFAYPLILVDRCMSSACLMDCDYCQALDYQSADISKLCLFIDPEYCFAFDKLFANQRPLFLEIKPFFTNQVLSLRPTVESKSVPESDNTK